MRVLKNLFGDGTKIHYKEIAVPGLEWHTADLQNGWTGNLYYAKNIFGQVIIYGNIYPEASVTHRMIIAELPEAYRLKGGSGGGLGIVVYDANISPYGGMVGLVLDNFGFLRVVDPLAEKLNSITTPKKQVSFNVIYMGE